MVNARAFDSRQELDEFLKKQALSGSVIYDIIYKLNGSVGRAAFYTRRELNEFVERNKELVDKPKLYGVLWK